MSHNTPHPPCFLIPIAGPALPQMVLSPEKAPMLLGRHDSCELLTPADEERVSRYHARFDFQAGHWFITDQRSTWGTFLNGYRIPPAKPHLLSEGDLLRITPWTFSFRSTQASLSSISPRNDLQEGMTIVRAPAHDVSATSDPIALLIEAAAGIHKVADEQTLAQLVIDFARRGTGYRNASYLRPAGAEAKIEVVASTSPGEQGGFSRSLLLAASQGEMALLDPRRQSTSQSIVSLGISAALCVPLTLGNAIAAYLYLDSRGVPEQHAPRGSRDQDYCLALSRVASLALANIKRVEIERRQASLDSQLAQAAAIQQYILPPRRQRVGDLAISGQSRPGQLIGGDFFDVIALADGRVALTLGDVSGKGVAASVLMTTIHGFLHALLEAGTALDDAVMRLNAFLEHRKPEERFATLFAAIIDTRAQQLTYLDAAHGYGLLWSNGTLTALQEAGGPPVGAFANLTYTSATVPFRPGDVLLAVSDGIVEQPRETAVGGAREQFEVVGIEHALREAYQEQSDELAKLFAAVEAHAGSPALSDDATALLVKWA